MPGPTDFAKLVPGFDFLQSLVKGAGQALPNAMSNGMPNMLPHISQWIAPTLDPEELGKRIEQLRTVQFWLEQNAKLLGATIQALEVQRMTLSTLKTMNMPMDRMREAFTITPSAPSSPFAPEAAEPPAAPPEPPAASAAIDPLQWWGALTQQFTELASNALKDSGGEAAKAFAGQAFKAATELPGKVVGAGLAGAQRAKAAATTRTKTSAAPSAKPGKAGAGRKAPR